MTLTVKKKWKSWQNFFYRKWLLVFVFFIYTWIKSSVCFIIDVQCVEMLCNNPKEQKCLSYNIVVSLNIEKKEEGAITDDEQI